MLWIGIGLSLVTAILMVAMVLRRRSLYVHELGSVSDHWMAEHRGDIRERP